MGFLMKMIMKRDLAEMDSIFGKQGATDSLEGTLMEIRQGNPSGGFYGPVQGFAPNAGKTDPPGTLFLPISLRN